MVTPAKPAPPPGSIRLQPSEPLPDPESINFATLSQFGGDISLLVGWFDVHKMASRARQEPSVAPVPFNVTHQFMMAPNTFLMLRAQMNAIYAQMVKNGVFTEGKAT